MKKYFCKFIFFIILMSFVVTSCNTGSDKDRDNYGNMEPIEDKHPAGMQLDSGNNYHDTTKLNKHNE